MEQRGDNQRGFDAPSPPAAASPRSRPRRRGLRRGGVRRAMRAPPCPTPCARCYAARHSAPGCAGSRPIARRRSAPPDGVKGAGLREGARSSRLGLGLWG
eukprot:scaffold68660_cov54-Phaeocystis_antarctica.AAC.7